MAIAPQQAAQNNDASTKELFVSAFRAVSAEEIQTLTASHGISSSGVKVQRSTRTASKDFVGNVYR